MQNEIRLCDEIRVIFRILICCSKFPHSFNKENDLNCMVLIVQSLYKTMKIVSKMTIGNPSRYISKMNVTKITHTKSLPCIHNLPNVKLKDFKSLL
jgi:hypothetical protein